MADEYSNTTIESLVLRLLHLSRQHIQQFKKPGWLKKVDDLLHDRWNENISLQELALIVDLHPASLSTYFTRFFGSTFGEYRRKIKIEKALHFMTKKTYTLTEIAFLCGFADQGHFTRTFKQITGWAPKSYRHKIHSIF
jgi:AraC family transcriptional regulator